MSRLEARAEPPLRWPPPWLGDDPVDQLNLWIPRALGALALVIVWISMLRAAPPHWVALTAIFGLCLLVYLIFVVLRGWIVDRRPVLAPIARDLPRVAAPASSALRAWGWLFVACAAATLAVFLSSEWTFWSTRLCVRVVSVLAVIDCVCAIGLISQMRLPPATKWAVAASLVLSTALFLASVSASVVTGQWLASPSIVMTVAAALVSLGTFAVAFPGELYRLPVATAIVAFALLLSAVGGKDNHAVRLIAKKPEHAGASVASALQRWYGDDAQRKAASALWRGDPKRADTPVPIVIVATAGGASRAGFWTAKVLGELQDHHPDFHNYLFAISGVSGGAYGATVYRALLNQADVPTGEPLHRKGLDCTDGEDRLYTFAACARAVIKKDFLSPMFLGGLYADLVQRFLPGGLLPDRATALELAWDKSWTDAFPEKERRKVTFSGGFHDLWRDDAQWLPALFLNGTSAKQGRQIITSNLAIEDSDGKTRFPRCARLLRPHQARDQPQHGGAQCRSLSVYRRRRNADLDNGVSNDRLIDGGYFENFGALTARDLAFSLTDARAKDGQPNFVFVVIQISSDPDMKDSKGRNEDWADKMGFGLHFAGDLDTPLAGLWNVRDGHGVAATKALAGRTTVPKEVPASGRTVRVSGDGTIEQPYYVHFRLGDMREPMSWALSNDAIQRLLCRMGPTDADLYPAAAGNPAVPASCEWQTGRPKAPTCRCRQTKPTRHARLDHVLVAATQPVHREIGTAAIRRGARLSTRSRRRLSSRSPVTGIANSRCVARPV